MAQNDCIFCKIVSGELPSKKVFENEKVLGFEDMSPKSDIHVLFIYKDHTRDIKDLMEEKPSQVSEIFEGITSYAKENQIGDFRIINNMGKGAGQTVFHTHFHVLAGKGLPGF